MPPPPPPPPLLPFGQKPNGHSGKVNSASPAPDRNALLSQIKKGANLKRVQTNDRSAPAIDISANKTPSTPSGGAVCRTNGPSPLIPPGGLFAYGMPKLRPTGSRPGDGGGTTDNTLSVTSNRPEEAGSRSHPPSPASKTRQASGLHRSLTENAGNRNFPSDLNLKGPAPAPPPANMKPNFSDYSAPNRHPTVRRSASQTSLGPKVRPARPPPNVRPPPPPKSTAALQGASVPPALPSKPPNVKRRQSFGVTDVHLASTLENVRLTAKSLVAPPPPPRNNSVPNSLDGVPNSSPTTPHVGRMNIAPPPPPPLRPSSGVSRAPSMRPPDPPVRPPCPPHTAYPAPPSQLKAVPSHSSAVPPPPPTRISSISSQQSVEPISDFEARFFHKFHGIHSLPPPPKFSNCPKSYPSKLIREKSLRRQPPPPPPMNNSTVSRPAGQHIGRQPVLHIQLQPRVFLNNAAHC